MEKSKKIPQVSSSQRMGTFKSKEINCYISNFLLLEDYGIFQGYRITTKVSSLEGRNDGPWTMEGAVS